MESREEVRREAEWLRIRGLVSRDGYNGRVCRLNKVITTCFGLTVGHTSTITVGKWHTIHKTLKYCLDFFMVVCLNAFLCMGDFLY